MKIKMRHWATMLAVAAILTAAYAGALLAADPAPDASAPAATAGNASPKELLAQANKLREDKSFHQAIEIYEELLKQDAHTDGKTLPGEMATEARVWLADSQWREQNDYNKRQEIDKTLTRMVEDLPENSRWRAEASESLGDLRNEANQWDWQNGGKADWLRAMQYWQNAEDLEAAKPRYIALNFKIARLAITQGGNSPYPTGDAYKGIAILPTPPPPDKPWENNMADWTLRNILRVGTDPAEKAETYFLLGRLRADSGYGDSPEQKAWQEEGEDYLKKSLAAQDKGDWRDDATFYLAKLYNREQRFVDAAEQIEAFLKEFPEGSSPWWDEAKQMRKDLFDAQFQINSENAFSPDSYIHLLFTYRNIGAVRLKIEKLDPAAVAKALAEDKERRFNPDALDLHGESVLSRDVENVSDDGKRAWKTVEEHLKPLGPGVYRLSLAGSGKAGAVDASRIIWVGKLAAAQKIYNRKLDFFAADAETGKAVAGAHVRLVYRYNYENVSKLLEADTDADGLAHFTLPDPPADHRYDGTQTWAIIDRKGEAAYVSGWGNVQQNAEGEAGQAVLYPFTDRPAYRPEEPIHWKTIIRYTDGKDYRLPTDKTVWVRIRDAQGNEVFTGDRKVSEYGSIEGDYTASKTTALGMLTIELYRTNNTDNIGSAQLARLEEYKLPEYKVVVTPGEDQVKFGAAVPFTIDANYYFGGPVADAEVEIVVHRNAFWPSWSRPHEYPWLWEDAGSGFGGYRGDMSFSRRGYYGWQPQEPETIVLTETKRTDAKGRVKVEIGALDAEAIKNAAARGIWGYEYRVEARVVDASRREVRTSGSVRSARTGFQAYLYPKQYLYLPGDKIKIDLKTLDPNNRPAGSEGMATIYRLTWNKDKKDDKGGAAPGYDETELFKRSAKTDTKKDGEGELDFEISEAGTYLVRYATQDSFGNTITGETTFFVADKDTSEVGFRSGGIEIVTDKDSYQRGETAQVMLISRKPGADAWFGVEGEAVHSAQVTHLDGTVKLVAVPITQDYEPDIYFTATSMFDYSTFTTNKRIVVPPTRRFLDVKIVGEKEEYRPGEKASVQIEVRDSDGKPVATELSLGVADASVWAIQSDVAADIRQHFWNRQRWLQVQTQASLQQYQIVKWQEKSDTKGQFELKRFVAIEENTGSLEMLRDRSAGGFGGGGNGNRYDLAATEDFQSNGAVRKLGVMKSAAMAAPSVLGMPSSIVVGEAMADQMEAKDKKMEEDESGGTAPARVRSNFNSTALWLAGVVTDADGRASATLEFPDSLTTWRYVARTADKQTRVGEARREVRVNKPIMVRPQAPRFFVEGDKVTLSAIVNNNSDDDQVITVSIDAAGLSVPMIVDQFTSGTYAPEKPSGEPVRAYQGKIKIGVPAHGQRRVDWLDVKAEKPGEATIKMTALSKIDSDAAEKKYPIIEYGVEQFIAGGLKLAGNEDMLSGTMKLQIPKNIKEGSAALTIHVEPTLAITMVNALEYLIHYPYGCVEQTLSRFVPTVITLKTLQQLHLKNEVIDKDAPKMIEEGLERLYDFQHEDGGWAWWKEGKSDAFMTSYVLQGLAQARDCDVNIKDDVIQRGCSYLQLQLTNHEGVGEEDLLAFMVYALSCNRGAGGNPQYVDQPFAELWNRREKLNAYTRALFALACHNTAPDRGERTEWAKTLAQNMDNGIVEDKDNGTAHWGEVGVNWRWSEGGVEATAFGLRALLAIDPQNPDIDRAMTWLARNRRGANWKDTRDTAIVVGALADYIRVRGEDKPNWTATVKVNGHAIKTLTVTPDNVFTFDGRIDVPAEMLETGGNTVEIERKGTGTLYSSAWLTYFTREEKIPAAGNEVFVTRQYFRTRLLPTLADQYKTVRDEIKPGDKLVSGDRVEVQLNVEAKNHYEYLCIEDMKAAGMEPTDVQSGEVWQGVEMHRELRDTKTAFFITRLPEGKHTFTYELRAEIPGTFQALPTLIHAMYVPEIRANSENAVIGIEDKK